MIQMSALPSSSLAAADPAETLRQITYLHEVGVALSAERNLARLLETILEAAKNLTHADGGTLYRVIDGKYLKFEMVWTDSLAISMGGTTGLPIPFDAVPLYDSFGQPNLSTVAAYSCLKGQTVNIADAYTEAGFDFSGTRQFDSNTGYRSKSFLTVPMRNHENDIIGVLQLINSQDVSGNTVSFSADNTRLVESLASQAAVAITNRLLIEQMETLFVSLVNLINNAIDEKSPYTSGHCERVPELTMMLAEAADKTRDGPLKEFRMNERDRYELMIAGLLHDCGKITTPVHVVDKSTKLQTIFDRIELIDTRFEVLKRDAEISALKEKLAATQSKQQQQIPFIEQQLALTLKQYDDDREFLRRCNIGSEAMSVQDQERVATIAGYSHIGIDGLAARFLSAEEQENLSIRSGTLTKAERNIINQHIVTSINMLESLPWPAHLKNVPEYAGGHHERMDGKGYPKGLKREQMSVQARIMGIADIFEALTAKDRPYKPGKPLSESLHILGKFALNGHIDPDLFQIFVQEKVWLTYAEKFLDAEQIDKVDLTAIPGYQA
jgi:HD-GYP domain-containing protein (c-di-GMP phosphodiesterase class II)